MSLQGFVALKQNTDYHQYAMCCRVWGLSWLLMDWQDERKKAHRAALHPQSMSGLFNVPFPVEFPCSGAENMRPFIFFVGLPLPVSGYVGWSRELLNSVIFHIPVQNYL